jgi:hypothetical protein
LDGARTPRRAANLDLGASASICKRFCPAYARLWRGPGRPSAHPCWFHTAATHQSQPAAPAKPENDGTISLTEYAEAHGMSTTTAWRRVKAGAIAVVVIKGKLRIPRAWLDQHPNLSPPAQRGADGRFRSETS